MREPAERRLSNWRLKSVALPPSSAARSKQRLGRPRRVQRRQERQGYADKWRLKSPEWWNWQTQGT